MNLDLLAELEVFFTTELSLQLLTINVWESV